MTHLSLTCVVLEPLYLRVVFSQHIDKVFKQKDLQHQLVDVKLHQAQALLKGSEDRHQKEKDFVSFCILKTVLQTCSQLRFQKKTFTN